MKYIASMDWVNIALDNESESESEIVYSANVEGIHW